MSKKLPKAIGRTIDDMRSGAAEARAETVRAASERTATQPSLPAVVQPGDVAAQPDAPAAPVPALPAPARSVAPEPPTQIGTVPELDIEDYKALLRRARAREIIARHATYAAAGGLIPLPIFDVAGVTAIIVHMARALARLYGVPEKKDRTRAIVLGLLGGAAPVGVGALATSSFMRFVPGANLVGMAVTSIAAAACTRSVGLIFLEHFESGGTLLDFKVATRRAE